MPTIAIVSVIETQIRYFTHFNRNGPILGMHFGPYKLTAISYNIIKLLAIQEPKGAYSELAPSIDKYGGMEALEERNLLEFSRQIAAGMVSGAWMYVY